MNGFDENTPVELRATESSLDALARAERESAPGRLEARVFMATGGLLPRSGTTVVVKRSAWVTRMRVAAAVALAAGIGAVWLASGGNSRSGLEIAYAGLPAAAEAPSTAETSTPATVPGVTSSPKTPQGATANQGPTA